MGIFHTTDQKSGSSLSDQIYFDSTELGPPVVARHQRVFLNIPHNQIPPSILHPRSLPSPPYGQPESGGIY